MELYIKSLLKSLNGLYFLIHRQVKGLIDDHQRNRAEKQINRESEIIDRHARVVLAVVEDIPDRMVEIDDSDRLLICLEEDWLKAYSAHYLDRLMASLFFLSEAEIINLDGSKEALLYKNMYLISKVLKGKTKKPMYKKVLTEKYIERIRNYGASL